jgi:hypothetical protein
MVVALAQSVEIEVPIERATISSRSASRCCGLVDHQLESRTPSGRRARAGVGVDVRGHATIELGQLDLQLCHAALQQHRQGGETQRLC